MKTWRRNWKKRLLNHLKLKDNLIQHIIKDLCEKYYVYGHVEFKLGSRFLYWNILNFN